VRAPDLPQPAVLTVPHRQGSRRESFLIRFLHPIFSSQEWMIFNGCLHVNRTHTAQVCEKRLLKTSDPIGLNLTQRGVVAGLEVFFFE
jgi:hypothetical protein